MPRLISRLPDGFLVGTSKQARQGLQRVLDSAGLRLASDGRRDAVEDVCPPGALIEAVPLDVANGVWGESAIASLTEGDALLDETTAARILGEGQNRIGQLQMAEPTTPVGAIRNQLLLNVDPSEGLATLAAYLGESSDFYLLRATRTFYARDFFWRLMTRAVDESLTWIEAQRTGPGAVQGDLATGHVRPSRFVCPPLVARNQPLAAVFETSRYAVIVAIPKRGAFVRVIETHGWPSGEGTSFRGEGGNLYANRYGRVPEGLAAELFESLLAGADDLARTLTNPTKWVTPELELETTERNIAWASTQFGLEALEEIGASWATSDRLWTGFRALGILEGLWQGELSLRQLLNPSVLRDVAVAAMPDGLNRNLEADLLDVYEKELEDLAENVDDAVKGLAQVRNLVHGAGTDRSARRNDRMLALRRLTDANFQLISDVARIWWTSVILGTEHLGPPFPRDGFRVS